LGRSSALDNVGSFRHAMWVARSPAEFVTNGRSPSIGSRQSSQRSVCCWDVQDSVVRIGQSSQEPSSVRHVVSLIGAAAFLAITKTSSRSTPIFSRQQIVVLSVPSCSSGAKHPAPCSMTMSSHTENGGIGIVQGGSHLEASIAFAISSNLVTLFQFLPVPRIFSVFSITAHDSLGRPIPSG
jgi:hypothetical protein